MNREIFMATLSSGCAPSPGSRSALPSFLRRSAYLLMLVVEGLSRHPELDHAGCWRSCSRPACSARNFSSGRTTDHVHASARALALSTLARGGGRHPQRPCARVSPYVAALTVGVPTRSAHDARRVAQALRHDRRRDLPPQRWSRADRPRATYQRDIGFDILGACSATVPAGRAGEDAGGAGEGIHRTSFSPRLNLVRLAARARVSARARPLHPTSRRCCSGSRSPSRSPIARSSPMRPVGQHHAMPVVLVAAPRAALPRRARPGSSKKAHAAQGLRLARAVAGATRSSSISDAPPPILYDFTAE